VFPPGSELLLPYPTINNSVCLKGTVQAEFVTMPRQYAGSLMFRDNLVFRTDACFCIRLIGSAFMTKKQELSDRTLFNDFCALIKVNPYSVTYSFVLKPCISGYILSSYRMISNIELERKLKKKIMSKFKVL
jgi:hypothetical protein